MTNADDEKSSTLELKDLSKASNGKVTVLLDFTIYLNFAPRW